jgi:hypothetical protein
MAQIHMAIKWMHGRVDQFGTTQFIFLVLRCDYDCHIVLYILELQNGTHFEILDFNMYIMQSIGWNIHKIVEVMNLNSENQNLLYQQQLVDGLWFGSMMDLNTC